MSVKYIPVQWNRNKYGYDAVMLAAVGLFLWIFVKWVPGWLDHDRPINGAIHNARAFGTCAFVMLSVILALGPLARLDRRFLPLLYNRRHFGVMTLIVALTHVGYVLNWYYAFSATPQLQALLGTNPYFNQIQGFPFEILGLFALLALMVLAFTSHDFWLKFLTAPVWKRLHYLIYPAYVAVVAHVALGLMQDDQGAALTWVMLAVAGAVGALHLAAAWHEAARGDPRPPAGTRTDAWVDIGPAAAIPEGRARIALLPGGARVAVFRHQNALSAISNACAHQNGPLGEGRILDCLVTCPWHGFQYDVRTGRSPAPFTERVPTYHLRVEGGHVLVDPAANPPGTPVDPVPVDPVPPSPNASPPDPVKPDPVATASTSQVEP